MTLKFCGSSTHPALPIVDWFLYLKIFLSLYLHPNHSSSSSSPQVHASSISLQKRALIPVIGFFFSSRKCHLFVALLLGETPSNFPSNLKINFLNPNETFNSTGDYYSEYTVCSQAFYLARNGNKISLSFCV